jgi:hypothetical protein
VLVKRAGCGGVIRGSEDNGLVVLLNF